MKQFYEKNSIDKDFANMLQEAAVLYQKKKHPENDSGTEFIKKQLKARKVKKQKKVLKSVAVVAIILVTGIATSIWCQVDGVYGGKRFIEKCVSIVSPVDHEEIVTEDGEISNIITIDNEEKLELAYKKYPEVKELGYIPDGYNFESLTIETGKTYTSIEYIYMNDTKPLIVSFDYNSDSPDIMIVGDLYKSKETGKEMYVDEIVDTNEYSIIQITDTYDCVVMGIGDKEEGIKVIDNINK